MMDNSSSLEGELAAILDSLSCKLLCGELNDVEAAIKEHPQYADQLSELLPAVQSMAKLSADAASDGAQDPNLRSLGDFRLIRELGRGGMGIVYEAEQISLDRRVALKVLPFASLLDERQLKRFRTEARAAAMLKHPHIVSVYSVGTERSVHFYAMELIDGMSLADVIASRQTEEQLDAVHPDSGTTPVAQLSTALSSDRKAVYRRIAKLGIQVAEALHYAHEVGVVHRDIKPANLLLDREGRVHVADFGLARIQANDELTMSGDVLGTLRYMSPEQFDQARGVDTRTDIYSLGLTLFELTIGRPMFDATDKHKLIRQILEKNAISVRSVDPLAPRDFSTIVLKATAKLPHERYATASDFADDLQNYLHQQPVNARVAGPALRTRRWCQRNRRVSVLAALVFLLLSTLALVSYRGQHHLRKIAANERKVRYVSDINRAQGLLRRGEVTEAKTILNRYVSTGKSADDLRGIEWALLRRQCQTSEPLLQFQHQVACYTANFSPDGRSIVTGEWMGQARVWDLATGELSQVFKPDGSKVKGELFEAEFSPDGEWLYTGCGAGTVRKWSLADGTSQLLSEKAQIGSLGVASLDVSDSCSWVAAAFRPRSPDIGDQRGHVDVWDFRSNKQLKRIDGWNCRIHEISFSPDDELLAIACADGTVRILETRSWSELYSLKAHESDVFALAFSSDSRLLATTGIRTYANGTAGEISVWDSVSGKHQNTVQHHAAEIPSIAFSPDGKLLAAVSHDHETSLWDASTLKRLARIRGHAAFVNKVCFSPNGQTICTTANDNMAKTWSVRELLDTSKRRSEYEGHPGHGSCVAFVDDSNEVWSIDFSGELHVWNAETFQGSKVSQLPRHSSSTIAYSANLNRMVALVGNWPQRPDTKDQLFVFDATTRKIVKTWELESNYLHGAVFSPMHPNQLAFGTFDHNIDILDIITGKRVQRIESVGYIKQLAFSPDGRRLAAVGTKDGFLKVFDTDDGREVRHIRAEKLGSLCLCVRYAPDGVAIATGGHDHAIKFWDATTLEFLYEIPTPNWILTFDFSPNGQRLLSTSIDGLVRLWDRSTRQSLLALETGPNWIWSAHFSPDGNTIAAAGRGVFAWRGDTSPLTQHFVGDLDDSARCVIEPTKTGIPVNQE